ncbi:hypothetical protein GOP47_0026821 [Adiantum capillus-veneris]|nr:hypothetical protein GOP47_0026821 [Adiantum capillus-veneris]
MDGKKKKINNNTSQGKASTAWGIGKGWRLCQDREDSAVERGWQGKFEWRRKAGMRMSSGGSKAASQKHGDGKLIATRRRCREVTV